MKRITAIAAIMIFFLTNTNAQNKEFGSYKKQFLYSYKLAFDFQTDAGALEYLNHKSFEVEDVWFRREFLNGTLTNGLK